VIEKIELVKKGEVRRAKLYYLRDLRGKAAKIREKRDGIEGYGDGILSTPAPIIEEAVPEVPAPVAATEVVVESPVAEVAVAEVPASDATTDVVVEAEVTEAPKAE
jgi:hypothetical protein